MSFDVVVVGSLNYDMLIQQDRLPRLGETFTGNGMMMMPGGKGANQAVQCAKLGLTVNMIGCVGQDIYGRELIQSLESHRVSIENIKKCGTSGIGIVQIMKSGDYCSTILRGANYHITPSDIKDEFFTRSPLVILQSEIPESVVETVIRKAKKQGCKVLLNNAPARYIPDELLQCVDVLVINETEASLMLDIEVADVDSALEAADLLHARIDAMVVITLGEKGSVVRCDAESRHFPAVPCPTVVDTTGAGDSFIGGLAYCMVKGIDIVDALPFAAAISAKSIQKYGGQSSFPALDEISPALVSQRVGIPR